jgi:tight adherence protein B
MTALLLLLAAVVLAALAAASTVAARRGRRPRVPGTYQPFADRAVRRPRVPGAYPPTAYRAARQPSMPDTVPPLPAGREPRPRPPGAAERRPSRRPSRRERPASGRPGRLPRLVASLPVPGGEARRRQELEEAVPEVLDVLRATIAAGMAPGRALQAAAEGAPPPLAALLGEAVRLARTGSGAGRALATAARAAELSELMVAGEALDLAETTGAPPGPVLAGVAAAAADRVRARQARMAATAQARLSARVVAAMAPAFLGVLAITSPSDAAFLVRERPGWATLAAAAAFEVTGMWWAGRIVGEPQG